MEIGSNDGVFLKNFPRQKVIGVEPCKNLAEITKKKFTTYPNFWNKILSKKILEKHSNVDLIFSANTISHIPNLKETFEPFGCLRRGDHVTVLIKQTNKELPGEFLGRLVLGVEDNLVKVYGATIY